MQTATNTENPTNAARLIAQLLGSSLSLPELQSSIREELRNGFARIESTLNKKTAVEDADRWLDARAAAKYMGGISRTTFDKYRYQTEPKLKGYPLDGKVLYKKSDIDFFVKLYAVKSAGL